MENRNQKCLVYLKWLRYLLWLLHLLYARAFERENKTLFITGRRAAAGKLLGDRVLAGCQIVWLAVWAGCHVFDWLCWLWMICMGRRKMKPPSTLWSTNWTQHLVISALSFIHPLWPAVCAFDCPWDPLMQCVCIFWFGFWVGFRKNHDSERSIFSAFVLTSVHVNSSECLVELWQWHLFPSICSFHLSDDCMATTDNMALSVYLCALLSWFCLLQLFLSILPVYF